MKTSIIDGLLLGTNEHGFEGRLKTLEQEIRVKYAGEFKRAGFWRRMVLRWRMSSEYSRERKKIMPSPHVMYADAGK